MNIGTNVKVTVGMLKGEKGEIINNTGAGYEKGVRYTLYAVQIGGRKGTIYSLRAEQLEVI